MGGHLGQAPHPLLCLPVGGGVHLTKTPYFSQSDGTAQGPMWFPSTSGIPPRGWGVWEVPH